MNGVVARVEKERAGQKLRPDQLYPPRPIAVGAKEKRRLRWRVVVVMMKIGIGSDLVPSIISASTHCGIVGRGLIVALHLGNLTRWN